MITLLVLICLALALSQSLIKKTGRYVLALTLFIFYISGTGIPASYLYNRLVHYPTVSNPVWQKQNAIVVLGGGVVKSTEENKVLPTLLAYSRIYEAARLYLSCKKTNAVCKIIISGGDPHATGKSEAQVYQASLLGLSINPSDIIVEPNSKNTYKNAQFTSPILKTNHYDGILLVTSGFHMKRSMMYFSHFGIYALPAVADYFPPKISAIPLGYNIALTDFFIHEFLGIMRFQIYNYFGWNKP
ncbi:MAG: YdcF family protein [Legionella sp.]|nr:YdcF family protein [Legionella sp.]